VVILDEGHNVEKVCEEAASFELSWTDLSVCEAELSEVRTFVVLNYCGLSGKS